MLAKTRQLVEDVTAAMDAYDLFGACARVRSFLDALTNWYIRRSRQRFWDGDAATPSTRCTPCSTCSCGSPRRCCRSSTEAIYGGLHHGEAARRSVHLTDWPDPARAAGRRRARRGDGPRARRLLGGAVGAQGPRPAGAPAAGQPHRRRAPTPTSWRRSPRSSPTRSTSREVDAHRRRRRRRRPGAAGGPGCARPAPRPAHPGGHQGRQGRRLAPRGRRGSWPAGTGSSRASTR